MEAIDQLAMERCVTCNERWVHIRDGLYGRCGRLAEKDISSEWGKDNMMRSAVPYNTRMATRGLTFLSPSIAQLCIENGLPSHEPITGWGDALV